MYKDINVYHEMEYKARPENDRKGLVLADGEIGDDDQIHLFKFVIKSNYTHPCAYMYLPEYFISKLHVKNVEEWLEENINSCHGDVTWCDHYVPGLDNDASGYWFGWDYVHAGDYTYIGAELERNLNMFDGMKTTSSNDHKYTVAEMLEDVTDVAEQLNQLRKDNLLDSKDRQLMKTFENIHNHCGKYFDCENCEFLRADKKCVIAKLCEELACAPSDWDLNAIKDILINYALWRV